MSTNTVPKGGKKTDNRNGNANYPARQPRKRTEARVAVRAAARASARQHRNRSRWLWGIAALVAVVVIGAMMYTSRTTQTTTTRLAPDFTLTDTNGKPVHLADYRGRNVVLYFSEGAGCQPCLTQVTDIEQHAADFAKLDVTVLPIVMNSAEQIRPDMAAANVKTAFLIDSLGNVSRSYDVLGKGMHSDMPGHGFVLIDAKGMQRWYGEYPSMYLSSADLVKQIKSHLT